jgi:hypothetical protein
VSYLELILLIDDLSLSDSIEQRLANHGHEALVGTEPSHRVRLARACLPVRKQARVVAIECILQNTPAQIVEHLPLVAIVRARLWRKVTVRLHLVAFLQELKNELLLTFHSCLSYIQQCVDENPSTNFRRKIFVEKYSV